MARPSIFDRMNKMQREMDKLFDHVTEPRSRTDYTRPSVDYYEDNGTIIVEMDVPGVEKDDITIELENDTLRVRAKKSHKDKQQEEGAYRLERSYHGFERTLPLPKHVDSDNATATYNNGVLEIKVPTLNQDNESNTIEVQ